nr:hypothetical protein [uncultured Sphingobacterium sp.]
MAKTFNNQELWKDYSKGICIEYNTELFKHNHLKFAKNKKYELIGNPVLYVEELIIYPIRANDDSWLSNLLFVKNQVPFIREDEYRIICTDINYNPTKDVPTRKKRITEVKELLLNGNVRETLPIRPIFNRGYINKVYYKNTVKNETELLEELRKYEIPWEKME